MQSGLYTSADILTKIQTYLINCTSAGCDRLIGIRFSDSKKTYQINMFEDTEEMLSYTKPWTG
jgi:hypothetical protein